VFALFLQQYVQPAWREQYIASFVSISGVFGGTAETVLQQLQPSAAGGPPLPYLLQPEFQSEQTFGCVCARARQTDRQIAAGSRRGVAGLI
jgi:hypothetical protein